MKLVIDGIQLDTNTASHTWPLYWYDATACTQYYGCVYRSDNNEWYVQIPDHWGKTRRFKLSTPEEILRDYARYLEEKEQAQIAAVGKLTTGWQPCNITQGDSNEDHD